MRKTHSNALASRQGRGTAWARHAMCESALSRPSQNNKILHSCISDFFPQFFFYFFCFSTVLLDYLRSTERVNIDDKFKVCDLTDIVLYMQMNKASYIFNQTVIEIITSNNVFI
jgi:hypothetical protein